jgi:hypothetical protein
MSLSDLAALGSFISGVAVLISLVYLSLQVRQAAKHSRSAMGHARATNVIDINWRYADPAVQELFMKAGEANQTLSAIEIQQLLAMSRANFFNAEDAFIQQREGLLDAAAYNTFVLNYQSMMGNPVLRTCWRLLRDRFDPEFGVFMDNLTAKAAVAPRRDMAAEWATVFAEEKRVQSIA